MQKLNVGLRQRVYSECRRVKVSNRGIERWDRKATVTAIRSHPLGKTLFPELFETEPK
jgi:hypothetical protein